MIPVFLVSFLFVLQGHFATACSDSQCQNADTTLKAVFECLTTDGVQPNKLVVRDLTSTDYTRLNKQWNLRQEKVYPPAYFLPTTSRDVADIVRCGKVANVSLIPNSGGHSYEATSWGTNDQIVIDFRNMTQVRVEGSGAQAVAYMEPGANMANIIVYLWEHGGYALSMGSCLTIGIGGHVIGGGMGWYAGLYGLATDNVLEVEVVDAQGNILLANETTNTDLFWAMRGSGPGFIGILTKIKVKLFQASKIKMTLVQINYALKDFAQGFIAMQNFQNWLEKEEPETGFLGFTVSSDLYKQAIPAVPPGMSVVGLHIQDPLNHPQGNKNYLKSVQKLFPAPGNISISYPSYLEHVALTASAPVILPHRNTGNLTEFGNMFGYIGYSGGPLPNEKQILSFFKMLKKDQAAPRYMKGKGFFTKKQFLMNEIARVQEVMARMPPRNIWLLVVAMQGKVKQMARNATAYVHRDARLEVNLHYEGTAIPAEMNPGMNYLYELYEAMKFMDGGESYQNVPDIDDGDHADRFYKENLEQLVKIKSKFDTDNYFRSHFSIPSKN